MNQLKLEEVVVVATGSFVPPKAETKEEQNKPSEKKQ